MTYQEAAKTLGTRQTKKLRYAEKLVVNHDGEPIQLPVPARLDAVAQGADEEPEPAYDRVSQIMAYESGLLEDDDVAELFQDLIDSGVVWTLQGCYGRTAQAMIEAGHCHPPRKDDTR